MNPFKRLFSPRKNRFWVIVVLCSLLVLGFSWGLSDVKVGTKKDENKDASTAEKFSHGVDIMKRFIQDNLDYLKDKKQDMGSMMDEAMKYFEQKWEGTKDLLKSKSSSSGTEDEDISRPDEGPMTPEELKKMNPDDLLYPEQIDIHHHDDSLAGKVKDVLKNVKDKIGQGFDSVGDAIGSGKEAIKKAIPDVLPKSEPVTLNNKQDIDELNQVLPEELQKTPAGETYREVKITDMLSETLSNLGEKLTATKDSISGSVSEGISKLGETLGHGKDSLKDTISHLGDKMPEMPPIGEKLQQGKDYVSRKASSFADSVSAGMEKIGLRKKREEPESMTDKLKDRAQEGMDYLKEKKEKVKDYIGDIGTPDLGVKDSIRSKIVDTKEYLRDIKDEMTGELPPDKLSGLKDLKGRAEDKFKQGKEFVKDKIEDTYDYARDIKVGERIGDTVDSLKDKKDRWMGKMKDKKDDIVEDIIVVGETAKDKIEDKLEGAKDYIKEKKEDLKEGFGDSFDYLKEKKEDLKDKFEEGKDYAKIKLDRAKEKLVEGIDYIKDKKEDITESFDESIDHLKEKKDDIIDSTKDYLQEKKEDIKEAARGCKKCFQRKKEGLEDTLEEGKDYVKDKLEDAKEFIQDKKEDLIEGFGEKFDSLKDKKEDLKDKLEEGKDYVKDKWAGARDKLGEGIDYIKDKKENIVEDVIIVGEAAKEKIEEKFEGAKDYIKEKKEDLFEGLGDRFESLKDKKEGLKDKFEEGKEFVKDKLGDAKDLIIETKEDIVDKTKDYLREKKETVEEKIRPYDLYKSKDEISESIDEGKDELKAKIKETKENILGDQVLEIKDEETGAKPTIRERIRDTVDTLKDKKDELLENVSIKDAVKDSVDFIKDHKKDILTGTLPLVGMKKVIEKGVDAVKEKKDELLENVSMEGVKGKIEEGVEFVKDKKDELLESASLGGIKDKVGEGIDYLKEKKEDLTEKLGIDQLSEKVKDKIPGSDKMFGLKDFLDQKKENLQWLFGKKDDILGRLVSHGIIKESQDFTDINQMISSKLDDAIKLATTDEQKKQLKDYLKNLQEGWEEVPFGSALMNRLEELGLDFSILDQKIDKLRSMIHHKRHVKLPEEELKGMEAYLQNIIGHDKDPYSRKEDVLSSITDDSDDIKLMKEEEKDPAHLGKKEVLDRITQHNQNDDISFWEHSADYQFVEA